MYSELLLCTDNRHVVAAVLSIDVMLCVRLRQIQMSELDAKLYERFSSSVRAQMKSLRVILDTLQVIDISSVLFQ